ncbi:MAG: CheR family methyltransferase [Thioalkalispiraceae bacterium]|jgi:chemotaxis protein methyltransferase CheR
MKDEPCVRFLQWALPQLQMRWPGFRRVYGQVCKRLARRVKDLGLAGLAAYHDYLETHPQEWSVLDQICQVTVTRFYRDKMMFEFLSQEVLPTLARQAIAQGHQRLAVWSIGCGSGEEPYSINLLWQIRLQAQFPALRLHILATEAKAELKTRYEQACYDHGTIKNLPAEWQEKGFTRCADQFCLKAEYRQDVQFAQQDIRKVMPGEKFDVILCRNLVFTYYEETLQQKILANLQQRLKPGGALVIGIHERLPAVVNGFASWSDKLRIYRNMGRQ